MTYAITISPVEPGWVVRGDSPDTEMQVLSGAKAETAAHNLARQMAEDGLPAEIIITLRDGSLAQRVRYGAAQQA